MRRRHQLWSCERRTAISVRDSLRAQAQKKAAEEPEWKRKSEAAHNA